MPCYKPRLAYQHKTVKQPLRFIHSQNGARQDNGTQKGDSGFFKVINDMSQYRTISIPCGQCIDCRLRNSQEKAIRLVHESKMSPTGQNCFLTLTYNDENLPRDQLGNAVYNPTHLTSFVARLRDHLRYSLQVKNFSKVPEALRFKTFGCAEYGDQFDRPHFHLLILNYDFKDKYPWRQTTPDWGGEPNQCYRSEFLESLWSHGNSEIGSVTEQSCGYVARYVQKNHWQNGRKTLQRPPSRTSALQFERHRPFLLKVLHGPNRKLRNRDLEEQRNKTSKILRKNLNSSTRYVTLL